MFRLADANDVREFKINAEPGAIEHVITFRETSSPELTELLDTYRQKVILPTYLAREQRKKIYNPKLKQILQNDPVTMEIDGVVHKFRYVNKAADLPSTRRTLIDALHLMKTPSDFQNLPALLEGCKRARHAVPPELQNKMLRLAATHNSLQVIIECVKAVERTGFKLNSSENINQLLIWAQWPAITSGWDEAKTKTALKQVRLILNILESDKNHLPSAELKGAFPFYRDPQVLASRLHMAAARAVYHQGGKDVDGTVTKYAEELVKLWPEGAGLLDLQPDAAYRNRDTFRYLLNRNYYLWFASPVLNGLTLAANVVDPGLAMQLQNRADKVDEEVKAALASPDRKQGGRGDQMYNALFNPQGNEEAEAADETA
ncbi:hypothetical protein NEMBOFW57_000398 [Staphylotrichum longicolle]|uniref:Uncharacterized protein n=1 Tax=Staphylotrichum longicolle TaxID=669026 RepID=A0AAD4EZ92_9PEZI|nr:hypothetical protein NEMBOFW57_000398 [Staphylotrichum longicolle]